MKFGIVTTHRGGDFATKFRSLHLGVKELIHYIIKWVTLNLATNIDQDQLFHV